tara:strand:+ start:2841 stop:3041 length:201 start_codon:yes stop_codon:yes gene_type:complete
MKTIFRVHIVQQSGATIEVEANTKEEAKQIVYDMSQSEIDDDAQERDYSDYIEIISVDGKDTEVGA